MEQDEMIGAEEQVRALADAVGLPLEDGQVPGLALAFGNAMRMLRDLGDIADAAETPVAGTYDAAWTNGGRQ